MLTKATHTNELDKAEFITVRVDYRNAGVGCDQLYPESKISEKEIAFGFRIGI